MYKYILKRLVLLIPVMLGVTLLVFAIMYLTPGDPAQLILGESAPKEAVAALRVLALLGVSMPVFWLGLMLILLFSVKLGIFPSGGFDGFSSVILPSVALGVGSAATVTRMTRSSMLEVIRQDYIRTARAKGVAEKAVINKHALKNALIPIITVVGLQFGSLLGGAVLTESVFSWPGVGRLMVDAIRQKDTPTVLASVVFLAVVYSVVNLLVDLLYAFVDPRIKSQYK